MAIRYNYDAINDEILSHKLSETIGRFCRLHNEGAGRKKCCCPFHHEKTPSFHLDDVKGLWHCFGCGEGGNVFTFIQKVKSCDFKQAVDELCEFFAIDRSKYIIKTEDEKAEDFRQKFIKTMDAVVEYYSNCLNNNNEALNYLISIRNLSEETLKEFNFGLANNDKQALIEFCSKDDIVEEDLLNCGIIKVSETDKSNKYLFFRDRIIIPIRNERGRVVAFGGRVYKNGDNGAKYLNSSENIFFKKKNILFNLNKAKKHLNAENNLIVVEGYMDAISLWQYGFKTAVAPLGTSITIEHLMKIFNYCKEPIFLFDSDEAGKKALVRACEMVFPMLKVGIIPRFCYLDGAKDVDEFLKKFSRDSLQERLQQADKIQDFIFKMKSSNYDLEDPNQKGIFQKEIFDLVALINDENLRRVFKEHFKKKFFFDKKGFNSNGVFKKSKVGFKKVNEVSPSKNDSLDFLEKQILSVLLTDDFLKKDEYFIENILTKLSKKNQNLFYKLQQENEGIRRSFIGRFSVNNNGLYNQNRIDDFLFALEIKKVEVSNLPQSIKTSEIQKLLDKKKEVILKSFKGYDEF